MTELPIIKYPFVLLSLFCCLSCSPTDEAVPENDELCNTDSVTYVGTIVPILEANCYTCHDQNNAYTFAEGIVLEGYDHLIIQVNKERLLGAIRHLPGFTAMPRNLPQLPECTIREIETWVEAGAPEN